MVWNWRDKIDTLGPRAQEIGLESQRRRPVERRRMGMSEMAEQTKTSQEPSMEEILSSIRRIIADEDTTEPPATARAAAPAPAPPAPAAVEEDKVLELT